MGVMRTKNHPPPSPRKISGAFFGNGGGCFHSCESREKTLATPPSPLILSYEMNTNRTAKQISDSYCLTHLELTLKYPGYISGLDSKSHEIVSKWLANALKTSRAEADAYAVKYLTANP